MRGPWARRGAAGINSANGGRGAEPGFGQGEGGLRWGWGWRVIQTREPWGAAEGGGGLRG